MCNKSTRIEILGHKISNNEIDADKRKVQIILDFRALANKKYLRSFVDLIKYLGKFLPDLGTTT